MTAAFAFQEPAAGGPAASRLRRALLWAAAVGGAVVLNALLFGLMPGLVDRNPERIPVTELVPAVNIVRVKRPEPPARRRETPREEPQRPPEKPRRPEKTIHRPEVTPRRMQVPFEVNPALPAGPATLPVLPMETVAVAAPRFKSAYAAGEIDSGLTPLAKIPPIYPLRAKRRGIEGWVTVGFVVNEQGRVEDVEIVAAEPEAIFDQSVRQCVSAWRFTPGKVAGAPVKTRVETTIRFELE